MWQVDCRSGWWDWLQGLFIWSLNGDNLLRRCWPSVSNLNWICNYELNLSAFEYISTPVCVMKAVVMRWQLGLMSVSDSAITMDMFSVLSSLMVAVVHAWLKRFNFYKFVPVTCSCESVTLCDVYFCSWTTFRESGLYDLSYFVHYSVTSWLCGVTSWL